MTGEISGRFHDLANKYAFLTTSNLLDDNYDCQLGEVDEDIEKEEFCRKEEIAVLLWKLQETIKSTFQLLGIIQRYYLGDSAPNIVILPRIFLTRAISVASRERSFSKLKLIKICLRSAMSQTRLADLAFLSIEKELVD